MEKNHRLARLWITNIDDRDAFSRKTNGPCARCFCWKIAETWNKICDLYGIPKVKDPEIIRPKHWDLEKDIKADNIYKSELNLTDVYQHMEDKEYLLDVLPPYQANGITLAVKMEEWHSWSGFGYITSCPSGGCD